LRTVQAPTAYYSLSLHDALPISSPAFGCTKAPGAFSRRRSGGTARSETGGQRWTVSARGRREPSMGGQSLSPSAPKTRWGLRSRSEEHTSELQSRENLVCRLLLE